MLKFFVILAALACTCRAQHRGNVTAEEHIPLTFEQCTSDGCEPINGYVVMDDMWRWVHNIDGYNDCLDTNQESGWSGTYCPDSETCTENCAVDGITIDQMTNTYDVYSTEGTDIALGFSSGGSRIFLLDDDDENYFLFKLLNKELTFTIDTSGLDCGMNGALFFSEMYADGGLSEYEDNHAGAAFGTGVCDAQCASVHWNNGEANSAAWDNWGSCCTELDIWEGNKQATAITSHPSTVGVNTRCEGTDCGRDDDYYNGFTDREGCDFNPYRINDTTLYGPGLTVDSDRPFTVVTQFITDDGTEDGTLVEIRRKYVQDDVVIENAQVTIDGETYDSVTDDFCSASKTWFGGTYNDHEIKGGIAQIGESLRNGMVMILCLWDDQSSGMLWLDGTYPVGSDPTYPGVVRGPCDDDSGYDVDPDSTVIFSNIRFGDLDTTY